MKTTELLTVLLIAFTQGLMDLMLLPLFYLFKDVMGVSPAQIPVYQGIAMIPWFCKPAFGFMSDQYPIFGSRRKSYLIILTLVEISAIIGIATIANSPEVVTLFACLQMCGLVGRNVIGGH